MKISFVSIYQVYNLKIIEMFMKNHLLVVLLPIYSVLACARVIGLSQQPLRQHEGLSRPAIGTWINTTAYTKCYRPVDFCYILLF